MVAFNTRLTFRNPFNREHPVVYHLLLPCAVVILIFVTMIWLLSVVVRRVSIIDAFWGPGFVLVAAWCYFRSATGDITNHTSATTMLFLLISVWGIRLGSHLGLRVWREAHEDRRYDAMKRRHDPGFWYKSLWIVFWLQGAVMWLVSLPIQTAMATDSQVDSQTVFFAGISLWLLGFLFEAVGDWQLHKFRANPNNQGHVLNTGLWRFTRHPNYFGDFLVWWGIWVCSIQLHAPLWTIVSPMIMSAFLMKFSGVGLLEKDIHNRRPGYAQYVQCTNAFFPWWPRTPVASNEMK